MSQQQEIFCKVCRCHEKSCYECRSQSECHNCNSLGSCCCGNTHVVWHREQVRRGLALEYFSMGWMVVEVIASVIAGLVVGNSFALLAFGGDSLVELISSYVVWGYLTTMSKGVLVSKAASEATEKFAAALLVLLILTIAGGAAYSYSLGIKPEATLLGIGIALGAVIVMPILWIGKRRIGKAGNMLPLTIDAVESATCFFMSLALLAGLLVDYFVRVIWADYAATAIILAFVALEAKELLEEMAKKGKGKIR